MSYQSSAYSHRSDSRRHVERGPVRKASQQRRQADYTLTHGGRQVRLGPVAFWVVVGTLVIMAGWSVLTGTYFAFQDDVLTRLVARQTQMQFAYEDRITELRAQIDRVTSRQLLDQEQFEQKLDQITRRQTMLEGRASALNAVGGDPTPTGSIKSRAPEPTRSLKPSPISDTGFGFFAPTDRQVKLKGLEGTLARLTAALDRVEAKQNNALNAIEENYSAKVRKMRGVLADLGLDAGKAAPLTQAGGPYIPVNIPADAANFERQISRINVARAQADKLTRTLITVPVRKPIDGEIDLSSGFGVRVDPFLGKPAMHTGLDFRGDTGEPARATAAGVVATAGWQGGYGKMVEVNHGNGLSTRYGHLSEINVRVGQSIRIGQMVGKIGSTGRSTGPHLHYETRIDGDAVDPQKFLRAASKLGNL
ncbi:MAG: peptidoglycan DD-metalloendopeptidase family protein [Pseudorhodoplanes sp.]